MRKTNNSNKAKSRNTKSRANSRTCNGKSSPKSNYKFKPKGDELDKDEYKSKTNDPSWYSSDENIMRDAASIPFSWAVGTTVDIGIASDYTIPGICALHTMPSFGYAETFADPLNVAATAVYSNIRYANSGSKNYDAPDLMMYILAMSQVYSYINMLQRVYGISMLYSQRNRYLPKALLKAMNVDFEDVISNLANFRYGINVLVNKASSFAVPSVFTLFNRQAFLYQNVYCEGTSIKDQLYMYVPDGFYQFGLVDNASALGYIPFTPAAVTGNLNTDVYSLFTVDQLLQYGSSLLQSLLSSEDMNIMSGDILKAYGDQGIVKLAQISPDYVITPVFDIAVLEQMKNSVALSYRITGVTNGNQGNHNPFSHINAGIKTKKTVTWKNVWTGAQVVNTSVIYQDVATNNIVSQPVLNRLVTGSILAGIMQKYKPMLTTTTADVNPALVMENSRLIVSLNPNTTTGDIPIYTGSEIVSHFVCWVNKVVEATETEAAKLDSEPYGYSSYGVVLGNDTADPVGKDSVLHLSDFSVLSSFKFRPLVIQIVVNREGSTDKFEFKGLNGDIDNYAVLDVQVVQRLHESALLNQLHVNTIARV